MVEKNEDKIKLSIFNFCKSRSVGHRYFAKQSNDLHITFNLKTKNFYITKSNFINRRRNTSTTKNDFSKIISTIYPLTFNNPFPSLPHPHPVNPFITQSPVVTPLKALEKLIIELDLELSMPLQDMVSPGELLAQIIMGWFIKVWEIKTSDNYTYYLLKHYPGIKKLRKYNMNLIHTILKERGLVGKFYNRLLNIEPECNITDLHFLQRILGDDGVKEFPQVYWLIVKILRILNLPNPNI